jgi:hypothetical protein
MAPELCHLCRWAVDSVSQACGAHRGWAALGPRTIGHPWSSADKSGKQSRRSEPMPANRCRSRYRPSGSLKATVRGSSPWRRTGHLPSSGCPKRTKLRVSCSRSRRPCSVGPRKAAPQGASRTRPRRSRAVSRTRQAGTVGEESCRVPLRALCHRGRSSPWTGSPARKAKRQLTGGSASRITGPCAI